MSKVASVFSGKGGVGKTTFLLNLAGTISNLKKKVLIIDTDFFNGGIAVALNKKPQKTIYDYYKEFRKEKFPDVKDYTIKYNNYIDFISAPSSIEEAKEITFSCIDGLISEAYLLYDVILFDTNHVLNSFNESLLKKMNTIFYIVTNDALDLKNSRNNLEYLKKFCNDVKIILNYSIHFNREYYILYDIKNILQNNIDYTISNRFNYDGIDNITYKGEILTINNQKWYDYKIFNLIAKSLINKEE